MAGSGPKSCRPWSAHEAVAFVCGQVSPELGLLDREVLQGILQVQCQGASVRVVHVEQPLTAEVVSLVHNEDRFAFLSLPFGWWSSGASGDRSENRGENFKSFGKIVAINKLECIIPQVLKLLVYKASSHSNYFKSLNIKIQDLLTVESRVLFVGQLKTFCTLARNVPSPILIGRQ